MQFRDNRQQSAENLESRERIMRRTFFEENKGMVTKDYKRSFDETEKIQIYMKNSGTCKLCYEEYLEQGLSEDDSEDKSKVSWSEYDADHIIAHIKGGRTDSEQGQVLCRKHNRSKKDK